MTRCGHCNAGCRCETKLFRLRERRLVGEERGRERDAINKHKLQTFKLNCEEEEGSADTLQLGKENKNRFKGQGNVFTVIGHLGCMEGTI